MSVPALDPPRTTSALPRWQRTLLAGSVLERPGARRSGRDWAVDIAMFVLAGAFGTYVLVSTWDAHAPWGAALDVALGAASLAALWLRRRRPVEVGLFVAACSAVSGLANGAALPAVFNAAIRAPFRGLAAVVGVAAVSTAIFPAVFPQGPDGRGYLWQGPLRPAGNGNAPGVGPRGRAPPGAQGGL